MPDSQQKRSATAKAPAGEWVAAIVSSILVCAIIAFLLYEGITGDAQPPLVTVRSDSVMAAPGGGYLVSFTARNAGGETAAGLKVSGALLRDSVVVERGEATIDYVPPQGARRGGIMFSRDPRLYRVELTPVGFAFP